MKEIAQIRKLRLWIFIIPILAINLCLIISQNPEFFENTIFEVDQLGRSAFSIPYIDGSLSISRASPSHMVLYKISTGHSGHLEHYCKNNNLCVPLTKTI